MKKLSLTAELEQVARRCVWYKEPAAALEYPAHFIAHVLTYGTYEDVQILRRHITDAELKEAINLAPPGVFDPRSWAYWNIKMGHYPPPPMPSRFGEAP